MKKYEVTIDCNGTEIWKLNGKLHREDGPAVIWSDGTKEYYLNGERHREDGPARIYADGSQAWYLNDQLHRTDGPARIWADGDQAWYLNGYEYPFEKYVDRLFPENTPQRTLFVLKWSRS